MSSSSAKKWAISADPSPGGREWLAEVVSKALSCLDVPDKIAASTVCSAWRRGFMMPQTWEVLVEDDVSRLGHPLHRSMHTALQHVRQLQTAPLSPQTSVAILRLCATALRELRVRIWGAGLGNVSKRADQVLREVASLHFPALYRLEIVAVNAPGSNEWEVFVPSSFPLVHSLQLDAFPLGWLPQCVQRRVFPRVTRVTFIRYSWADEQQLSAAVESLLRISSLTSLAIVRSVLPACLRGSSIGGTSLTWHGWYTGEAEGEGGAGGGLAVPTPKAGQAPGRPMAALPLHVRLAGSRPIHPPLREYGDNIGDEEGTEDETIDIESGSSSTVDAQSRSADFHRRHRWLRAVLSDEEAHERREGDGFAPLQSLAVGPSPLICPALRELSLAHSVKTESDMCTALALATAHFPGLTSLDLQWCALSAEAMRTLAGSQVGRSGSLSSLRLDYGIVTGGNCSDAEVADCFRAGLGVGLITFSCVGCSAVGRLSLGALSDVSTRLREVRASWSSADTGGVLRLLTSPVTGPSLRLLEARGCSRIATMEVNQLNAWPETQAQLVSLHMHTGTELNMGTGSTHSRCIVVA